MIRKLVKITSITALLPSLFLCIGANAAVKNYENTWFEIEVILFSQLGDKSLLQEAFPDTSEIDTPKKTMDLLGPYLHSDIASLKNRLPLCKEYLPKNDSSFTTKTFEISYKATVPKLTTKSLNNLLVTNGLTFNNIYESSVKDELIVAPIITLDKTTPLAQQSNLQQEGYTFNNSSTSIELNNKNTTNEYTFTSFNVPQEFCAIPETYFNSYKQENPYFSYNNLPLAITPLNISGEEDLTTENPYLISQESLQLKDIIKQLKRSRNFKPLMHMGWRQRTQSKKNATSLKLYAGENLIQPYYESMSLYNSQQKTLAEKQIANQTLIGLEQNDITFYDQQEALQTKVSAILQQAKISQYTLDSILNNTAEDVVTPLTQNINQENEHEMLLPQMPPQGWSIDGFLTVDVGHFLHVTADFNIINMSLGEQATRQLARGEQIPLKSIRFKQNKRVRSKEIHYFDHPYMGMIVQIRRHEQIPLIDETNNGQLVEPLIQPSTVN